jgi:hypothetical protein
MPYPSFRSPLRRFLLVAVCGAVCGLGASSFASAQDYPLLLPQRDAAVIYDLDSSGTGPMRIEAHVSARDQKLRLQEVGKPDFLLVDRGAEQVMVVAASKGLIFAVPTQGFLHRHLDPGTNLRFSRGALRSVLGIACTVWRVQGPKGYGDGCVTPDGIILAASGQGDGPDSQGRTPSGHLTAESVSFALQPPDLFQPPDGLQQINLPPSLLQSMLPSLIGVAPP